jgi:hypothetical protein
MLQMLGSGNYSELSSKFSQQELTDLFTKLGNVAGGYSGISPLQSYQNWLGQGGSQPGLTAPTGMAPNHMIGAFGLSNSVAPIDPKYLSGISPEQLRIMQVTGAAPQYPPQGGVMANPQSPVAANPSTPVANTQQTASSLVPQTSQVTPEAIPQQMPFSNFQGNQNLSAMARNLIGNNVYRSGRGFSNPGMDYSSMMDMLMRRYYGNQGSY